MSYSQKPSPNEYTVRILRLQARGKYVDTRYIQASHFGAFTLPELVRQRVVSTRMDSKVPLAKSQVDIHKEERGFKRVMEDVELGMTHDNGSTTHIETKKSL